MIVQAKRNGRCNKWSMPTMMIIEHPSSVHRLFGRSSLLENVNAPRVATPSTRTIWVFEIWNLTTPDGWTDGQLSRGSSSNSVFNLAGILSMIPKNYVQVYEVNLRIPEESSTGEQPATTTAQQRTITTTTTTTPIANNCNSVQQNYHRGQQCYVHHIVNESKDSAHCTAYSHSLLLAST